MRYLFKIIFFSLFFYTIVFSAEIKEVSTIDVKKDVMKIFKREEIVKIALSLLGIDYIPGSDNLETGFDCSGFTEYVYFKAGIKIPRSVIEQYNKAAKIYSNPKKGDLVFFSIKLLGIPDHVGIYIGNGKFIHSPSIGKNVRIDSLNKRYWQLRFISYGVFI